MKKNLSGLLVMGITLVVAICFLSISQAFAQKKSKITKIGVYDSRAIVFAYSRSGFFADYQSKFRSQNDSANKVHDTLMVKQLSVQAMSYQHLLHQMIFATGTTAALVKLVKDQLPEVAKKAGVNIIMSKYELAWADPEVQTVDITNEMVRLFKPTENIDEMLKEIQKTDPVPLEELTIEQEMLDLYCTRFGKK